MEFERLDRRFRFPKLCTCLQMRSLYPGINSYSLSSLCKEFDIKLQNHPRALDDALAAAELLKIINEKKVTHTASLID